MKKWIFLNLFLLNAIIITQAQIREIPGVVTEALSARYPHAVNVSWKDRLTSFQADFQLNNHTMMANFNSKGEWQSCECMIDFSKLPASVKDGFSKSKYAVWEKISIAELQAMGNPVQYKIVVQKGALQKKGLYFNADGVLQKEQVKL